MLEISKIHQDDTIATSDVLPIVRLEEHWPVVQILTGWAYNKRDIIAIMRAGSEWPLILDVYNASNKYQFHTLAPFTSRLLRSASVQAYSINLSSLLTRHPSSLSLPKIDDNGALKIYSRACLFGDEELIEDMLPVTTHIPLQKVPSAILHELTTSGLVKLVRQATALHSRYCSESYFIGTVTRHRGLEGPEQNHTVSQWRKL